jgi:hypothetical protein
MWMNDGDLPRSNSVSIIRIIIPGCPKHFNTSDRKVRHSEDFWRMNYDPSCDSWYIQVTPAEPAAYFERKDLLRSVE